MTGRRADISKSLRDYRITRRLRQEALARELGVSQSQISRWESGRDRPRADNVAAIARLLWGGRPDLFVALRHFVLGSHQAMALFDLEMTMVARSAGLVAHRDVRAELRRLDAALNPSIDPVCRRYRELAADPGGTIGLTLRVPAGARTLSVRLALLVEAGITVALAEFALETSTAPAPLRCQEVRIDEDGQERHTQIIWT